MLAFTIQLSLLLCSTQHTSVYTYKLIHTWAYALLWRKWIEPPQLGIPLSLVTVHSTRSFNYLDMLKNLQQVLLHKFGLRWGLLSAIKTCDNIGAQLDATHTVSDIGKARSRYHGQLHVDQVLIQYQTQSTSWKMERSLRNMKKKGHGNPKLKAVQLSLRS